MTKWKEKDAEGKKKVKTGNGAQECTIFVDLRR
jgi:hypothetical protein